MPSGFNSARSRRQTNRVKRGQRYSITQQMQSYFSEIEDRVRTRAHRLTDILSTDKEPTMIAVFVCFRYESEFNEAYVRQIADSTSK